MSSTTYPLIQNGSFTEPTSATNLHFEQVVPARRENRRRVNGTSGGSIDTTPVYIHGLSVEELVCSGWIRQDSDGSYGFGQSSTLTPGLSVNGHDWVIRRVWQLFDVTGSGHTSKNWAWGLPMTLGNVRGNITSAWNTDFSTNSVTLSTVLNNFGTLSGTAKLESKDLVANFTLGGPGPVRFAFEYSGAVTYTGTNFSWLFPTAPADPIRGTFTLDVDATGDITGTAILYDFTVRASAQDGGDLPFTARLRVDQA